MAFSQRQNFTESLVAMDHDEGGVYEFSNSLEMVVYVGSSNQLKSRLTEHLNEAAYSCIKLNAKKYRYEYTADYLQREQQVYDEHVALYGKPPKCNHIRPPGR